MSTLIKTGSAMAVLLCSTQAMAQISFYAREGWRGQVYSTDHAVSDLTRSGFNDRASSVVVEGGRWEVCEHAGFGGRCVILRRGSYENLRGMELNNAISSVRPVGDHSRSYQEVPPVAVEPSYVYRRRPAEEVYQAQVTSVHAVLGPPERRCWTDRELVRENNGSNNNAGGALAGAIIGGILGHQVGGGSGRDAATAGGAIAGAVVGSRAGGDGGSTTYERDVRRCQDVPAGPPEYWDVSYRFRGIDHRIQMRTPPGSTIDVNANGEPRQ